MTQNKIKLLRMEKRISQETLAKAIGVNRSTITAYEIGRINIPESKLYALSNYFKVSSDFLIGISQERGNAPQNDYQVIITDLIADLSTTKRDLNFHGKQLDQYTKALLIQSLENSVSLIESITKEK